VGAIPTKMVIAFLSIAIAFRPHEMDLEMKDSCSLTFAFRNDL
jgi:hypothetical protein